MGDEWTCACGETDVEKHDLGMVIAHEYGVSEQVGRGILVAVRDRAGLDTPDEDKVIPWPDGEAVDGA